MGVIERLVWMNKCSKNQCRSLYWRMRAAMKKVVKKQSILVALYGGPKKGFNFQYDPSSYALNFDDGSFHHQHHLQQQHKITQLPMPKQQGLHLANTTRVYVIRVGYF